MASCEGIDGRGAFEMLMNRLIEESRETHSMRERLGDTAGDLRSAQKKVDELTAELALAQKALGRYEVGNAARYEFMAATGEYLGAVVRALGRDGIARKIPAAERKDVAQSIVNARGRLMKAREAVERHICVPV